MVDDRSQTTDQACFNQPTMNIDFTASKSIDAERCAALADRLRARCESYCAHLTDAADWHEGYRFALASLARRIRNEEWDV